MTIEELERSFGLKKEAPNGRRRTFVSAAVRGIDSEKRTIRAYASTKAWDRYGERFESDAFKDGLASFKKNPVILFGHDYSSAPIAKAIGYEFDENGLILTMKFADTPKAKEVFALYEGGFMSAFSVGFRPLEYRFEERVVGSGEMGAVFVRAELLENSAVPVPANPEAVVIKGLQGKTMSLSSDILQRVMEDAYRLKDAEEAPEAVLDAEEVPEVPVDAPVDAAPEAAAEPPAPAQDAPKSLKEALGYLLGLGKTLNGGKVTDEATRSLLIQANNLCRELVYGRGTESLDGMDGDMTPEEMASLVREYEVLSETIAKSGKANAKDIEEFIALGKTIEEIISKGKK